jgi:hypothetical protein
MLNKRLFSIEIVQLNVAAILKKPVAKWNDRVK